MVLSNVRGGVAGTPRRMFSAEMRKSSDHWRNRIR
jgi:hypothetical protein